MIQAEPAVLAAQAAADQASFAADDAISTAAQVRSGADKAASAPTVLERFQVRLYLP